MSHITIFNGIFCREAAVVREVVDRTGCKLVTDEDLVANASKLSGLAESSIERAFLAKTFR